MSTWLSVYSQDSCSYVMEQLIFFHDHVMVILLIVMVMVGYVLGCSCVCLSYSKLHMSAHVLESLWTAIPIFLLLLVAFPSLWLLYLMEDLGGVDLSVSVVGHQWFWSYEYSDFVDWEFDSYLVEEKGVLFRLLTVSNSLFLPINTSIKMVVSSLDVIHSWTLPSLGVSSDAVPGRLNQIVMMFNRLGMFTGQCSEICGLNHSFMPIVVYVVSRGGFFGMFMCFGGWVGVNLLN